MSRLESILSKAVEMRAGELWLAPGEKARVRVGREWKDLSTEVWSAQDTKSFLSAPLSEFDKREFFEKGFWTGSLRVMNRPFQLQLQITTQGIAGSFKWKGSEALDWESWNLPGHIIDLMSRSRGMTIVTGPGSSGKSSLLFLAMQKLGPSTQLVHFYSDTLGNDVPARVSSFSLKSLSVAKFSPADVLIVEDAPQEQWPLLLDLSESGRHVVFSMTAIDLFSGLERWRAFHELSNRKGLANLQLGLGTRLVAGVEAPLVPAVELLLVTQKIRDALNLGTWSDIEDEMRLSGEKTGMRTMNQSLLQLLLRRKIEMRTAFHESQAPDEFDQLLKKVGI